MITLHLGVMLVFVLSLKTPWITTDLFVTLSFVYHTYTSCVAKSNVSSETQLEHVLFATNGEYDSTSNGRKSG